MIIMIIFCRFISAFGDEVETSKSSKMLSIQTPYDDDLKSLAALIVKPKHEWKEKGVVTLVNKRKLPKYFILNLFNPFAKKEYGYVDPLSQKRPRPNRDQPFDVKTAEIGGLPLLGRSF